MLNEIPAADRNTILNLFSAEPKRIVAGVNQFRRAPHELSLVLEELLKKYQGDADMPQTLAEMIRDSRDRVIADIPPTEYVERLPLEKLRETQDLIARRLAEVETKKPASPRAAKGRRKTGTTDS